ncbi:MAG: glycosyltransferase [Promethearchaeota archaeon]
MNRKLAICTLCIGPVAGEFGRYTHPAMRRYAKRVGADFIVFNKREIKFTGSKGFNPLLFEKYQVGNVLETHDRVLFLDTDILVTPGAPDVFDLVPAGKVGGVLEDVGTEREHRRSLIKKVQDALGDVGWTEGFMNSGVFVVSKEHEDVFSMYEKHGFYDGEYEQTNTNWYIHKAGFEIHDIDFRFNFMGMMRILHGPLHRDAYFIHYAGKGGLFPWVPKIEQVKNDYEFFYEGKDVKSFEEI